MTTSDAALILMMPMVVMGGLGMLITLGLVLDAWLHTRRGKRAARARIGRWGA